MILTANGAQPKHLHFEPLQDWSPALPQVIWHQIVLTPHDSKNVWDLSHLNLGEALKALRADLDFTDFLLLHFELKALNVSLDDLTSVQAAYGFNLFEDSLELGRRLSLCPKLFQDWTRSKKMGFNDLRPLLRCDDLNLLSSKLGCIHELHASKNEGVELLELFIDWPEITIPAEIKTIGDVLKHFRAHSKPQANARDTERQDAVKTWPWPSHTKGTWVREGDQSFLQVQMRAKSPIELEAKLENMKPLVGLWKNL